MRIRSARFSKISILKGRQTADKQSEFYLFICPPLFQCPRIVLFAPVVSVWTKPNTNFFQHTKLGLVKLFVLLSSSALFVFLNHFFSFEVWKFFALQALYSYYLHLYLFRDTRHCMSASSSQLPADVHRRMSSGIS